MLKDIKDRHIKGNHCWKQVDGEGYLINFSAEKVSYWPGIYVLDDEIEGRTSEPHESL